MGNAEQLLGQALITEATKLAENAANETAKRVATSDRETTVAYWCSARCHSSIQSAR